jgi:crotonobetainyl-CoA:carnitine CoA-transferase CaiB-like acyl-CoA transferase
MDFSRAPDDIGSRLASAHARALLFLCGHEDAPAVTSDHPALAWRRAGLCGITGSPEGPGLVAPVALTAAADGALAALQCLAPAADLPACGALLLGERARLLGLTRGGNISANGSSRLLAARDGHVALNLPRPDDWTLLPALFGAPASDWAGVTRLAAERTVAAMLAQGRLLGLAIAPDAAVTPAPLPFTIEICGEPRHRTGAPLIIDFSGLWAGPLAGSLLQAAGARIIKIESTRRPDGARSGNQKFFNLLNAGKTSLVLDFLNPEHLRELQGLIDTADIVIESSRPRALAALGIHAEKFAAGGGTWISITAHGRRRGAENWIGFGDDAAVAGGLSAAMRRGWGEPLFAGDAIADPLTGITAALAGWAAWLAGGGRLISLALADVTAHACALFEADKATLSTWQALAEADTQTFYTLRMPPAQRTAKRIAPSSRTDSALK